MARKVVGCRKYRCENPHYRFGFCEKHYDENNAEKIMRDDAINALHFSKVDGQYFQNITVKEELHKIQKWWQRICSSVNSGREDKILKDETECSMEWCISLAEEIVKAEKKYRNGDEVLGYEFENTRKWVWERFNNLEKGLMSNRIQRPAL